MTSRVLWVSIGITVLASVAWAVSGRGIDVLLGSAAPVMTTAASWWLMKRTWAESPEALMSVMVRGFAAKCLFYVAWVTIMLKGLEVRPGPFVGSLTVSFLVLHLVEAGCLRRLMANVVESGRRND